MKILFVYTDINTMGLGARSYHFGIGILSAVLKQQGHKTNLFYTQTESKLSSLFSKIQTFQPEIIGFTSDTTQFPYIKKIISKLKPLQVFTILGGCHASLSPDSLTEIDGLNAICIGEGEDTLCELVQALEHNQDIQHIRGLWYKTEKGEIIKNATRPFISNLDLLPFSDYELFDYQKIINSDYGRLSFMLSRGCPFGCTYCSSPMMGKIQEGTYVRFMSVDRAIDELKYLKKKYNFKSIFFADDTFTINKKYVFQFSEKYKKEIDLPFEINARVETISVDMLNVLKETGCIKIHMGIEHGNEDFRKNVLNRHMSNERIITIFKMVKESGIKSKSYNIVGFPFETKKLHQDTVSLNRLINPDAHVCYIFQPYPGTKLYEICKENNFLDNNFVHSKIISRRDTVLNLPTFFRKEIVKCHRDFSYKVYKENSLRKAILYKIYYSAYGEKLIKLASPIKNFLRNLAMK